MSACVRQWNDFRFVKKGYGCPVPTSGTGLPSNSKGNNVKGGRLVFSHDVLDDKTNDIIHVYDVDHDDAGFGGDNYCRIPDGVTEATG
ncbi:hypothetical protein HPB47_016085 [Ixodes persulcatus]|uniref:Uncharacterized protein n=1 Tax=Ixodes persulcatus TaxID=34615 RepID=A0AC60R1X1_IXOPE|nr:hypothetical protein HPB47_016085 [Ixodes persulcatus]